MGEGKEREGKGREGKVREGRGGEEMEREGRKGEGGVGCGARRPAGAKGPALAKNGHWSHY